MPEPALDPAAARGRALDFLRELGSRFPEWKVAVDGILEWLPSAPSDAFAVPSAFGEPGVEESVLEVNPGPADITVSFGGYHTHFSFDAFEPQGMAAAFLFIDGLLREHLAVCSLRQGAKCLVCWVVDARTLQPVDGYPLLYFVNPARRQIRWPWLPARLVSARSWHGGLKLELPVQSALERMPVPEV